MSDPVYVLHIGTEKTGTTAIQNFLGSQHRELSEHGIYSAGDSFQPGLYNNLQLCFSTTETLGPDLDRQRQFSFEEYQRKTRHQIESLTDSAVKSGSRCVVFSSEHLSSRLTKASELSQLRSLFPKGANFHVVVYLRRQRDLFLGAQAESIKSGNSRLNPTIRISRDPEVRYGISYYDYVILIDKWRAAFPDATMTVRPFSKSDLVGGNAVKDFVSLLGANSEFLANHQTKDFNKRLSPEALLFLASINPLLEVAERIRIVKVLEAIDRLSPGSLIDPINLSTFEALFAQSNAAVAQEFLQRPELFDDSADAPRFVDPADVDQRLKIVTEYSAQVLSATVRNSRLS